MKNVFVVTATSSCGEGFVEVFNNKKDANKYLNEMLESLYEDDLDYCETKNSKKEFLDDIKNYSDFHGSIRKKKIK